MTSAALLILWSLTAATPPSAPSGCPHYSTAKQLLQSGNPAAARAKFEACLALNLGGQDNWNVLLGIALSYDQQKDSRAAARFYNDFLEHSRDTRDPKWLSRRVFSAGELARLEQEILQTHGIVELKSRPSGATVRLDGRVVADRVTPMRMYLAPGSHSLELSREGFQPYSSQFEVRMGMELQHDATLAAAPVGPKRAPAAPKPRPEPAGPWALVGVGSAAIVVGAVLTGLALADEASYDQLWPQSADPDVHTRADTLFDRIDTYQKAYWTLYIGGAALVIAGAIWRATSSPEATAPRPSLHIGRRSATLSLGGRF